MTTVPGLGVLAVDGVGEVGPGADLSALLLEAMDEPGLLDGDVVAVTSKVVSKAEGRVVTGDRDGELAAETDRVLARRGPTAIVRTHHGLVLAAGGIDASNTEAGTVVLLPRDPDASARALREALLARSGRNVAVVVTDTAGRAWRTGQTDLAIGVAGLLPLDDHAGRVDPHGNALAVTAPAVADEVAGAADLVAGKLGRRPFVVVRGLAAAVLPAGTHGPGAAALVRPEDQDMFGLGAREAVIAALAGDRSALRGFGAPVPAERLVVLLGEAGVDAVGHPDGSVTATVPTGEGAVQARALAFAHGWPTDQETAGRDQGVVRFTAAGP